MDSLNDKPYQNSERLTSESEVILLMDLSEISVKWSKWLTMQVLGFSNSKRLLFEFNEPRSCWPVWIASREHATGFTWNHLEAHGVNSDDEISIQIPIQISIQVLMGSG